MQIALNRLIVWVVFFGVALASAEKVCPYVKKGKHYQGTAPIPYYGFHHGEKMEYLVTVHESMANYLLPDWDCQGDWNKLFGASRCGYFHLHHDDSDRFVWMRSPECILRNGSKVIGVDPNCEYLNTVQIAAYSYDKGRKPYQTPGLEKPFDYRLKVGIPYKLEIFFYRTSAVYKLSVPNGSDGYVLTEEHTIQHTPCDKFDKGYLLSLYFGGNCVAPIEISACYDRLVQ